MNNQVSFTHIGSLRFAAGTYYREIFKSKPDFAHFWANCLGNVNDVTQLYELCGDDVELINSICSLSQAGFGYTDLRMYVIDKVAPK